MKALIVHAHPEPKSFTTALKDLAQDVLVRQGFEVKISDLYASRFEAVADAKDFGQRQNPDYLVYALEQRENVVSGSISRDIQAELDKLLWADLLILNFPLYWYATPAILKGWIDRVLVSGVAYGGKRFYDRGGLQGKRALVTATLGGQRHMFGAKAIHGELECMLRPLLRGTLQYVGIDVLPPFFAYHVPYITNDKRQEILKEYENYLNILENLKVLKMPSMNDYDENLHPLSPRGFL